MSSVGFCARAVQSLGHHSSLITDAGLACAVLGLAISHGMLTIVGIALVAFARIAADWSASLNRAAVKPTTVQVLIDNVRAETVELTCNDTVAALKKRVQPLMDLPPHCIAIVYKGKLLEENGKQLKDYVPNDQALQGQFFIIHSLGRPPKAKRSAGPIQVTPQI